MEWVIDIFFKLFSHLPRIISFWLYSPERTKKNVEVFVSAQEGSVEVWCDKIQSNFSLWVEVKNNNPFPIEIDRAEASGYLHNARLKALNLIGIRLKRGESKSLHLEGRIDLANLEQINQAPNDETLRLEVRAVIINKYHNIRDFTHQFDRLMCRYYNKKAI